MSVRSGSGSQIKAMSSSWTKPHGPVAQAFASAMARAAGLVLASGNVATRSAKWPGLLTLTGLIGDWLSVRFPVESKGRKSKGVSRSNDPSGGRGEETPDVTIAKWKSSIAGVDGTSLATGGRASAGDAEEVHRRVTASRAGPARERGQTTRGESVPLGIHGAEVLDDTMGKLGAGTRSATAWAGRDRAGGTL